MRRLASAVIAAMWLVGCTAPVWLPASVSEERSLEPSARAIAKGVYLHSGRLEDWGPSNQGDVSNASFVVGERCVAVIDTGGSMTAGRRLRAAVRQATPLPVCYVINTHAHPDHVLGNQAFKEAVAGGETPPQFVGHARLPAALAVRGPYYLNALRRDFGADEAAQTVIVPPTILVTGTLEVDLGGRTLRLQAWPTAHTDADLSVLDEPTRTLFLGDLLFIDHTPVLDGRLKGWLAVLAQLRAGPANDVSTVVPGHGAASTHWPAALDAQQRYLETLQSDVRRAIKQGLTLSQAVAQVAPDRAGWQLLDVFHARNVTAAYAELEWED